MTEKERTTVTKYIVCDQCGYAIDVKTSSHAIITINRMSEESFDLHFHLAKHNDAFNCLQRWSSSAWTMNSEMRDLLLGKPNA